MKLRISDRMSKPDFQGDFTSAILKAAAKKGVAVCPGDPFYEEERGVRTMRINYSNSSDEAIEKGIKILGDTLKELLAK